MRSVIDPHESISAAYAHAIITCQWEFCAMIEACTDKFIDLCDELVSEGKLPPRCDEGYAGVYFQVLIEDGAKYSADPRFAQLFRLTKLRLMVDVSDVALSYAK